MQTNDPICRLFTFPDLLSCVENFYDEKTLFAAFCVSKTWNARILSNLTIKNKESLDKEKDKLTLIVEFVLKGFNGNKLNEKQEELKLFFNKIIVIKSLSDVFYEKRTYDTISLFNKYFPIKPKFDTLSFERKIHNLNKYSWQDEYTELERLDGALFLDKSIPKIFDDSFLEYGNPIFPLSKLCTSIKCDKILHDHPEELKNITSEQADTLLIKNLLEIGSISKIKLLFKSTIPLLREYAQKAYCLYLCDSQSEEHAVDFLKQIGEDAETSTYKILLDKHVSWKADMKK